MDAEGNTKPSRVETRRPVIASSSRQLVIVTNYQVQRKPTLSLFTDGGVTGSSYCIHIFVPFPLTSIDGVGRNREDRIISQSAEPVLRKSSFAVLNCNQIP